MGIQREKKMTDKEIFQWVLENTDLSDPDGCWITRVGGPVNAYGQFSYQGKITRAHSWVHHWINVDDPVTLARPMVLHWCDYKKCIKPDHLRAGTALENSADARRNQRVRELSDGQVVELRRLRSEGWILSNLAIRYGISESGASLLARHLRRPNASSIDSPC